MTRLSTRLIVATGCAVAAVACGWTALSGSIDLEWLRFTLTNASLVAATTGGVLLLGVRVEAPTV